MVILISGIGKSNTVSNLVGQWCLFSCWSLKLYLVCRSRTWFESKRMSSTKFGLRSKYSQKLNERSYERCRFFLAVPLALTWRISSTFSFEILRFSSIETFLDRPRRGISLTIPLPCLTVSFFKHSQLPGTRKTQNLYIGQILLNLCYTHDNLSYVRHPHVQ